MDKRLLLFCIPLILLVIILKLLTYPNLNLNNIFFRNGSDIFLRQQKL